MNWDAKEYPVAASLGYRGEMPTPWAVLRADHGMLLGEYLWSIYSKCEWWVFRGSMYKRMRQVQGTYECALSDADGCSAALDAHHLRYDSMCNEPDSDLELLCRRHHRGLRDWAGPNGPIDHGGIPQFRATL